MLCTISISFEKHQQRNKVKLIYNHPPTLYEYSKVFRTYTKCTEKRHNRGKLTNREARYSGNVKKPKINNQNNTKNTEIAKFPCLRIFGLKLQRKLKKRYRNCTSWTANLKFILWQDEWKLLPGVYAAVYALYYIRCNYLLRTVTQNKQA